MSKIKFSVAGSYSIGVTALKLMPAPLPSSPLSPLGPGVLVLTHHCSYQKYKPFLSSALSVVPERVLIFIDRREVSRPNLGTILTVFTFEPGEPKDSHVLLYQTNASPVQVRTRCLHTVKASPLGRVVGVLREQIV